MSFKNTIEDGYIFSSRDDLWKPMEVQGSYYLTIYNKAQEFIAEDGDWKWLHYANTDETLTVMEAFTYGKKFAVLFNKLGFQKGDSFHAIIGNHNLSYSLDFGAWILGGVASHGDINLEPRGVAEQLQDLKPKMLFFTPDNADLVRKTLVELGEETSKDIHVFSLGETEGFKNVLTAIKFIDPELAPEPYVAKDPASEVAIIFWSAGTTGHPKGICHSHHSALNWPGFAWTLFPTRTNAVTTTCFFHVGGFLVGIIAIMKRQTYYHMFGRDFKLPILLKTITEQKPKNITVATHHFIQLAESGLLDTVDPEMLDSVEIIIPAGATVPPSCEELIKKKMKNVKGIANTYGQSELGAVTYGISSSVLGMVYPGCRVKIIDINTGERCGPNTVGEMCVKTPSRMVCLLNREVETAEFFDDEGYGHTGDLAMYNEDGDLVYVDRLKEIIKSSGNHVSPTELEDILQKHPAVFEVLVYGRPEPAVFEVICAVVMLKPGFTATEEELLEFVNSKVTEYKKIKGGIIFRDEIPRNSVGKLVRREMRAWAISQMN